MIKQSAAQSTGRAGERWFQSILPKEWIFQKPEEDIGLDGKIITGSEHTIGGLEFGVQIKASNKWKIKNGAISVDGIKMDTLLFWGSRPFPTLLVLYDVSIDTGYYGWAFDLVKQPIESAVPFTKYFNKKTLTMRMPATSILNKDGFLKIKIDVDTFYLNLIRSVTEVRSSVNLLPTINKLTEALRGIFFSFAQQPKDEEQLMLIGLTMVTSHKQIIQTMNELQNKYQIEQGCDNFIQHFITVYKSQVKKIIHDFDKTIDLDVPHITMYNPDAHYKITPKLIDMIMDLILILTDGKFKDRGTVFTFEKE